MRTVRRRLRLAAAAVLVAGSSGLLVATAAPAHAAPCSSSQTPVTLQLSTGATGGTADTPGMAEPDWTLVSTPSSTTPAPVFSVRKIADYVEPRPMGNWISPSATTVASGVAGDYRFRTQFTVPAGWTVESLNLYYAADDGVAFTLNGNPIGGTPSPGNIFDHSSFNQLHRLYLTTVTSFVTGLNTLDAIVDNDASRYGLVVLGGVNLCA